MRLLQFWLASTKNSTAKIETLRHCDSTSFTVKNWQRLYYDQRQVYFRRFDIFFASHSARGAAGVCIVQRSTCGRNKTPLGYNLVWTAGFPKCPSSLLVSVVYCRRWTGGRHRVIVVLYFTKKKNQQQQQNVSDSSNRKLIINTRIDRMWKLCVLALSLASVRAQDDLDSVREMYKDDVFEIWKQPAGTTATPVEATTQAGAPFIIEGSGCICVEYYNCDPETNTTFTDGKVDGFGKIDIRFVGNCTHLNLERGSIRFSMTLHRYWLLHNGLFIYEISSCLVIINWN